MKCNTVDVLIMTFSKSYRGSTGIQVKKKERRGQRAMTKHTREPEKKNLIYRPS